MILLEIMEKLQNYIDNNTFFRSVQSSSSFRLSNSLFLGTYHFAEICHKAGILGGNSTFEAIFYIKSQYQVNIGHFMYLFTWKVPKTP